MPLDTNIALGIRQPEQPNMLAQMAQAMAIRGANQEYDSQNALSDSYQKMYANGKRPNAEQITNDLAQRGYGHLIPKLQKQFADTANTESTTAKNRAATVKEELGTSVGQLAGVTDVPGYFDWVAASHDKELNPALADFYARQGTNAEKAKAHAQAVFAQLGPEAGLAELKKGAMGAVPALFKVLNQSEDNKQTNAQSARNNAATVGATLRGQNMRDDIERDRLAADTAPMNLSPEALDAAAVVFNQTGRLPPVGVGKRAAQSKVDIMTRAGQLAGGPTNNINPTEAPPNVNNLNSAAPPVAAPGGAPVVVASPVAAPTKTGAQIGAEMIQNKQDNATQGAALKNFATGTQGNRVTFLNTAVAHGDTLAPLVDALDNGDMTAINAAKNFYKKQMGKEAPLNFDAVKRIYGEEITKAIVANGGTGDERKEAGKMLDAANSPAQLKGVIDKYQELLGGQLEGLRTQYKSSTGRDDFDTKLHERTKEVLVRKRGGGGGGATPKTAVSESEKSAALKWAEANPGDTRAAQIRSALGAQ